MDNIRLRIFGIGGRDDSALPRLLERLPKFDMRESDDAYRVYEWLSRDQHVIGKGSAVNGILMRTRRYAMSADMLIRPLAIAFNARGWAVMNLSATPARQA